jgi:hypothetical protein
MKNSLSLIVHVRRILLSSLLGLLVITSLSACGGGSPVTLNQANLDKIQQGMSSAEVKSILGEPSDSKSEPIPIVGGTKTTYVYENNQDRVVIVLKNDTVQSKEGHFGSAQ